MLTGRYQAVSVSRPGLVWMLGGRDGSEILMDNEILLYPASFEGSTFEQKSWQWAHKKMKNKEVWNSGVPEAMKKLPIPLTGHCAVDINTRYVLVFGGGTTMVDDKGNFIMNSEPEPTNHLHLYDFEKNVWHSTYGKPAPGATFHYEFCCCFPQPAHTLHALESSIFNGILCRLLHLSDLDLPTTMS